MRHLLTLALVALMWTVPASAAVTKAAVKDISGALVCYCGCGSKVVATCGCGTADQIEADIATQLEQGKTREQIIAAYVAEHGEKGLAAPTTKGFNLTAWLMPGIALLVGGVVIRTAVVRWRRKGREYEAERQNEPEPTVNAIRHQERILKELEEMD